MRKSGTSTAQRGSKKGSFANSYNGLLPLFPEPDEHGERRWREVFGYERRKIVKRDAPFIARGARRSSSDS